MYVQVGDKTARAQFNVAVVEAPSRPRNVKIVEIIGSSVQLKWDEPKDDGNNEIIGYYVEKRDKRSGKDGQFYVCHERVSFLKINPVYFGLGPDQTLHHLASLYFKTLGFTCINVNQIHSFHFMGQLNFVLRGPLN